MDVVGRVKEIGESISAELKSRKEKLAADAKDAIRRLDRRVKELVCRAERGSLTKVDEDLENLAADVTRKMGRIALGSEEAQRMKRMLGGFQEEVLAIRRPESEEPSPDPSLLEENKALKEENTALEKGLAGMEKQLEEAQIELAVALKEKPADTPSPPAKKTEPAAKKGGSSVAREGAEGDGTKTPEQEAEEQAEGGKKGDAKK